MATLADLKSAIVSDLARDDLETDIPDVLLAHINKAVRKYRVRNWWFLQRTTTTSAVISQNYVTRPATIERIRRVSIPALGYDLERVDITDIEALDEPSGQTGQPIWWAEGEAGGQLRLYPAPSVAYTIKLTGTRRYSDLAADADDNPWTNEAADLIAAETKATLCRDVFADDEGFNRARGDVIDAVAALDETNIDRMDAPIPAGW